MNPKAEIFFDAITLLEEGLVEEAQDYRFRKKRTVWKNLGSLAACLMLIASISLLALPRGCGGSAPKMNSAGDPPSADSSAPAEAPDQNAPALSGEPAAPEPAEAPAGAPEEDGYGQIETETVQFTAVVLSIDSEYILLGGLEGADEDYQVRAQVGGLELPELAEGDTVRVTHTEGPILTTNPPILSTIVSVEKVETDG